MGNISEKVLVLDFGGQYSQLIARKVRALNVYCEIKSHKTPLSKILEGGYKGIILSGGFSSVNSPSARKCDPEIFEIGVPILGICYGARLIAKMLGGKVEESLPREIDSESVVFDHTSVLTRSLYPEGVCWMNCSGGITEMPEGFTVTAHSDSCSVVCMENQKRNIYAVQFHPEVEQTNRGLELIKAFLYSICGCSGHWNVSSFVGETILEIKEKVGDKKVICALSGGLNSSVAALLVHKAIGDQLTCVLVDNGFLRKDEGESIDKIFKRFGLNTIKVDASHLFLGKLKGVSDPGKKRQIIGETFVRVFEEEAKKIGKVEFLCQGTIYSDVIESGLEGGFFVKAHHNVSGLPSRMDFKGMIEPLKCLFKDEVRKVGRELRLGWDLLYKQSFPGSGLAVRIMGEVTPNKLRILRDADAIFREEIIKSDAAIPPSQYFAVLTDIKTSVSPEDEKIYGYTVALRAVSSTDYITAKWTRIPHDILEKISTRIVNEVGDINRVVYDITAKPPAAIEWE